MTQYIGEKEIKEISENLVTFTDESDMELTDRQLEYMITDEAKDLSEMRELLLENITPDFLEAMKGDIVEKEKIVADVMKVIEDHNLRKGDLVPLLDHIMNKYRDVFNTIVSSYNYTFNTAVGKAFGTYEEGKHTEYFLEDIRVSDINVLIQ